MKRPGGSVELADADPHGLLVLVNFPVLQPSTLKKALKEQDKAAQKLAKEEGLVPPSAAEDQKKS